MKDAIQKRTLIWIPDREVGRDVCQIQPALNNRFYINEEY